MHIYTIIIRWTKKNISLWLLCGVQHSLIMADYPMAEAIRVIIYVLSLLFKGSFRTLSSSFYVSYTSSFLPVSELECAFYYAPCWLIDCASWNNATSLTTYIMHSRICDTNKYNIYIHSTSWKGIIGMALWAIKIQCTCKLYMLLVSSVAFS